MRQIEDEVPAILPDDALLAEYLAGRGSPTDRVAIERWFAGNPKRAAELQILQAVWLQPASGDTRGSAARFIHQWRKDTLDSEVVQPGTGSHPSHREPRRLNPSGISRWGWPALAATLAVVLTTFVLRTPDPVPDSSTTTYSTRSGERADITLSDGTQISLNVGSRIDIPDGFNRRGNRTVRLTGEAYFHVRHAAGTPFTVVAGPSTTRVLGTSFVVRHYATDTAATIAVQDGKVAVHSVILTRAQQASVSRNRDPIVSAASNGQFTFETGILTIGGIPFPDAIPELNRWYDADIQLGDAKLNSQQIAGEFSSGSIAELSEILAMTYGVRVVRSGRTLTLYPR